MHPENMYYVEVIFFFFSSKDYSFSNVEIIIKFYFYIGVALGSQNSTGEFLCKEISLYRKPLVLVSSK